MKKFLAAVIFAAPMFIMTPAAQALIMSNGTFTTDTDSGLDWLDVTASVNMSYDYVSSQLGTGGQFEGWRYATGIEFNNLVTHATGVAEDPSDPFGIRTNLPPGSLDDLMANLGITYTLNQILVYTFGIIDDVDVNQPSAHWIAGLFHSTATPAELWAIAHYAPQEDNSPLDGLGSFLVRTNTTMDIPEPSTIALMGLGLAGIGFVRKKKQI